VTSTAGNTAAERQRRKREKAVGAGLVQCNVWVPAHALPDIRQLAEELRKYPDLVIGPLLRNPLSGEFVAVKRLARERPRLDDDGQEQYRTTFRNTAKAIVTPEGRFATMTAAAVYFGIARNTVTSYIKRGKPGWYFEDDPPEKRSTGQFELVCVVCDAPFVGKAEIRDVASERIAGKSGRTCCGISGDIRPPLMRRPPSTLPPSSNTS
jgi:hypothetical protein